MRERFPVQLFAFAFLGWTFDFYDLVLIGFIKHWVAADLHLTPTIEALMLTTALCTSGLGGIVSGMLADRVGKRTLLSATVLAYSVGSLITGLAPSPGVFLLGRAIVGLGVGGEWAIGHAMVAEAVAPRLRGRASAWLQAGEPTGVALAALVGYLLVPAVGWRLVLLGSSATALLALAARRSISYSKPPSRTRALAARLIGRWRWDPVGQSVVARRVQAWHLLELLHLATGIFASRNAPIGRAQRYLGTDGATGTIHRNADVWLLRRQGRPTSRILPVFTADGGRLGTACLCLAHAVGARHCILDCDVRAWPGLRLHGRFRRAARRVVSKRNPRGRDGYDVQPSTRRSTWRTAACQRGRAKPWPSRRFVGAARLGLVDRVLGLDFARNAGHHFAVAWLR